jgi:hypothetical protein
VISLWAGVALVRSSSATDGDRGFTIADYNAMEILSFRVFPDPSAVAFFRAHGMPLSPDLQRRASAFSGTDDPMWRDRSLRRWVDEDFNRTYAPYLLRHPVQTALDPVTDGQRYLGLPLPASVTRESAESRSLGGLLSGAQVWSRAALLLLAAAAVAVALVRVVRTRRLGRLEWTALGVLGVSYVLAVVVWSLAAIAFQRLYQPVGVPLRIGLGLLAVGAVDGLVEARRPLRLRRR